MAMSQTEIETMIREAFPDARVEVKDLAGDGKPLCRDRRFRRVQGEELASVSTRWSMRRWKGTHGGRRTARACAHDVGELRDGAPRAPVDRPDNEGVICGPPEIRLV